MQTVKNNKRTILLLLLLFIGVFCLGIRCYILSAIFIILSTVLYLDSIIKRRVRAQVAGLFTTMTRNCDYLIIGDICDPYQIIPSDKKIIQISAPDRSFHASQIIFKRLFSLLDEEHGNVIFVINKKRMDSKDVSVFDLPMIHPVTLKNLKIEKLQKKNKYPLIAEPIKSMKWLVNRKYHKLFAVECVDEELIRFCKERGIGLHLYAF